MTIRTLFAGEAVDRTNWIRHLLFPGVLGLTFAIVIEFFRFLNLQPKEAMELLSRWGPNFILGLLIVAIIGGLLSQVIDISRDGVAATRQMAEAMGKIAEKDDRQMQEIQTLMALTAQQSDRMQRQLESIDRRLRVLAKEGD